MDTIIESEKESHLSELEAQSTLLNPYGENLDFKEIAARQLQRADQFVRTNPYAAVGIAIGIGFVAAALLIKRK